jgi:hypothetical protein|tara:strand:+ start:1287 stop:3455 length:2169 start_codon:yes stop_codon:yes gene_type:complete
VKKTILFIFSLSLCLAAEGFQIKTNKYVKKLQHKYNIYTPEDLKRFRSQSNSSERSNFMMDMDNLVGQWKMDPAEVGAFVTVGTDQNIPNMLSLMGVDTANGGISVINSEFNTELYYLVYGGFMDLGDEEEEENRDIGEDDYTYGPRIGAYLTDLDPTSGSIYFDETDTTATITFIDVPLYDNSDALNTFQIQLFYGTNEIVITYQDLFLTGANVADAAGGLAIGIGDGNGGFTNVDFSESSGESFLVPIEGFSALNELDMAYKRITFIPNDDFSEYSVSSDTVSSLEGEYINEINVEDDGYLYQALSSEFVFYGEGWEQIYVNNDGNIGFEDGDETCVCWDCDDGDGQCAAKYLAGGSGSGNDDSDDPDFVIMNFDFNDIFTFIFGFPIDGVDNPFMVSVFVEQGIVLAQGLTPFGEEPDMFSSNADNFSNYVNVDTNNYTVTFNYLNLYDSNGSVVATLDGSIGPKMVELLAGIETRLPSMFLEDIMENEEQGYTNFFEDSTGNEISTFEDIDGQEMTDTLDFYWYTSADSLYMIDFEDYNDPEGDWDSYFYQQSADTLIMSFKQYPCEDYLAYYGSMDDCVQMVADSMPLPMVSGLENVNDFYMTMERMMTRVSTVSTTPDLETLPGKFALYPAYPNPFNPNTSITYELPKDGIVNLTIYDVTGRKVRTLVPSKIQRAGFHRVTWNATNDHGQSISAGMYIYKIQSEKYIQTKKMVLIK